MHSNTTNATTLTAMIGQLKSTVSTLHRAWLAIINNFESVALLSVNNFEALFECLTRLVLFLHWLELFSDVSKLKSVLL